MKTPPLQRHPLANCWHEGVNLLSLLTVVSSNNWSSLVLKVCASFMLKLQSFCFQTVVSAKLSHAWGKCFLVHSTTFLWGFFCSGLKPLCPFSQKKSIVLCCLSQQGIFPDLRVAYCSSLFPLYCFIVFWRCLSTSANCHIMTLSLPSAECAGVITLLFLATSLLTHMKILTVFHNTCPSTVGAHIDLCWHQKL